MFKGGKLGCFTPVLVTFDVLSVSKIPMCWRPDSEKKVCVQSTGLLGS